MWRFWSRAITTGDAGNDILISGSGADTIADTDPVVVTITNWFLGSTFQVESIVADGNARTLSASKVQGLVNAMSSFAPPPLGQTTLTSAYANALGNLLASSWK